MFVLHSILSPRKTVVVCLFLVSQEEVPVSLEETSMSAVTATCSDTESFIEDYTLSDYEWEEDVSVPLEDVTMSPITVFSDSVDLCGESIYTKKKNALKEAMGSDLISRLLLMTIYEQRSILASFCEDYSKKTIESVIEIKVS